MQKYVQMPTGLAISRADTPTPKDPTKLAEQQSVSYNYTSSYVSFYPVSAFTKLSVAERLRRQKACSLELPVNCVPPRLRVLIADQFGPQI